MVRINKFKSVSSKFFANKIELKIIFQVLSLFIVLLILGNCSNGYRTVEGDYKELIEIFNNGDTVLAIEVLSKLDRKYPKDPNILMTKAMLSFQKEDYVKVIDLIKEYRKVAVCNHECQYFSGMSYANLGDTLKAIKAFRGDNLEIEFTMVGQFSYKNYFDFNESEAYLNEAKFWYHLDSLNHSYGILKILEQDVYDFYTVYNYLGSILIRHNEVKKACEYFNNSCRLGNNSACQNQKLYCFSL